MLRFNVLLAALGGLLLTVSQPSPAEPQVVGASRCKTCHGARTGNQWKAWTESAHARAFETLSSAQAMEIADSMGLANPREEPYCLGCHSTRGSLGDAVAVSEKGAYDDGEGVGCESCHGPGSEYRPRSVMTDPDAARAAGLVMVARPGACTPCHNDESPTYTGFDFVVSWSAIAHPVPVAEPGNPVAGMPAQVRFRSSVGDVSFPHDLHVTELGMDCVECHHQIHALRLDTPHPAYLESSWINCRTCHSPDSDTPDRYYKCSVCHHSEPANIADETLSSKVVVHKNCWGCHETGTGVDASKGCIDCHARKPSDSAHAAASMK